MPAPILVTGYSRPDLFGNLLNQISGLGVNKYIFVDGVATEAEQEKKDLNNKCREIAFEFSEKNPNTHCFLPESNLGLSRCHVSYRLGIFQGRITHNSGR
jgi:hypothetical protein